MRRAASRHAPLVMCLLGAATCTPGADPGEGGETDTDTAREPANAPIFIQPASGELMVASNRVDDLELRVTEVVPSSTLFVLDRHSQGDLTATPWIGDLEPELVRLRFRGGLVSGRHSFFLETPSVGEPARSASIELDVAVEGVPQLTASFDAVAPRSATSLLGAGVGGEGVLLLYEHASEEGPRVTAFPTLGAGWDLAAPARVRVAPLVEAGGVLPLTGAIATAGTPQRDDDRLRLAWRTSAAQIDFVDRPLHTDSGAVRPALRLDALDVAGYEYAALGRPMLVGDAILVETTLLSDAESSRPGDHRVVAVALRGAPADPQAARLLAPTGIADIDRLGLAVDFAYLETTAIRPIAARIDGARAAVFDLDETGGLRLRSRASPLEGWAAGSSPLLAVLGALGSRTMLGVAGDQIGVQTFDDSGENDAVDASSGFRGGGTADDAGVPVVAVLQGHPIVIVPLGSEHPANAIAVAGSRVSINVLDEIQCEQMAVAVGEAALREPRVQFACRTGTEVRFGTLAIAPS